MSTGIFKQRKITLNSIAGIPFHTGSTFLVEYSTDYVNYYTSSIDLFVSPLAIGPSITVTGSVKWNEVFLPYAGATASVLLPTGSVAMRLTDLEYPTSQYIQIFITSTTTTTTTTTSTTTTTTTSTTTTTAAPTTTTTTTTAAPTTTTTTTTAPVFYNTMGLCPDNGLFNAYFTSSVQFTTGSVYKLYSTSGGISGSCWYYSDLFITPNPGQYILDSYQGPYPDCATCNAAATTTTTTTTI